MAEPITTRQFHAAEHHPEVDLRHSGVTVRLLADAVDGLSLREVELARQISAGARTLGVPAEPSAVQEVQVTIDALLVQEVGEEDLIDPHSRGPSFWFQEMDASRPQRNRIHVDIFV